MKIEIFDTTLRDGAQADGISYSVRDMLSIADKLDSLGLDFIEAGNPASNPKDQELFSKMQIKEYKNSKIVAFGATHRKNVLPAEDENLKLIAESGTDYVCIFGKSWDMHVSKVLKVSLKENLKMIENTVRYFTDLGKTVFFDAEHYFDGYKYNPDYAIKALKAAVAGGATRLILCDTNGGSFPDEVYNVTKATISKVSVPVGIHCHDDTGCAVANSLSAVKAGAVQVQGTFLGFGERCGNANLAVLIANLQLKLGFSVIPEENMSDLLHNAQYISEISNISIKKSMPYIGKSAFAHKAGMHIDGVQKLTSSFEHISPELVGNKRGILLSEVSGKAAVLTRLNNMGLDIDISKIKIDKLLSVLKDLEYQGFQFEAALASFEIMVARLTKSFDPFFTVDSFRVITEKAEESDIPCTAVVKIWAEDKTHITAAEGEGPVHALDTALRKAIVEFYPSLKEMRLTDYKVRVLEPKDATAATVRVLIESADAESTWTTVGVSSDVINASWNALIDSIEYKLLKDMQN